MSPSRLQGVVLVAALCFLAGVAGWWINEPAHETFNDVDTGFLADMTLHHGGAIGLSFAYLGREHDSVVGHFAREIVLNQSQEIALMNGIFEDADGRAADKGAGTVMAWMGTPMPSSEMPGMASAAELAQLRAAVGVAADDEFTRLMIRHHAAGAAMADYARRHGESPRVQRLATGMARVQRLEINEMNARRVQLGLPRVDPSSLDLGHLTHR